MKILGADVSTGRTSQSAFVDLDVIPGATQDDDQFDVSAILDETLDSLPAVVERIVELDAEKEYDLIGVDATGFGRGAIDYLLRTPISHKIIPVIANSKASREHEDPDTQRLVERQFANFKTRVALEARRAAYRGRLYISAKNHARLVEELPRYTAKKVGGRWKLEDPKKSPDVADAFLMAFACTGEFQQLFWIGSG